MTEKRAKCILDFIAKRKGWLYMSMRDMSKVERGFERMPFIPYVEDQKMASPIWIEFKDKRRDKMLEYTKDPGWKKILRDLLKYACSSNVLKITDGVHGIFMKQGDSLEKILVEMDLVEDR